MANTKFDDTNLKAYRGDTETYKFTVTKDGAPFDLSTYTLRAQGREDTESVTTLWDVTLTDGVDGNDWATGIVVLKLDPAITETLLEKSRYDIQAIVGTTVLTLVKGQIALTKDVTRIP